jgi:hypothetical protein
MFGIPSKILDLDTSFLSGVLMAVVGNIAISIALNLQKYAHRPSNVLFQEPDLDPLVFQELQVEEYQPPSNLEETSKAIPIPHWELDLPAGDHLPVPSLNSSIDEQERFKTYIHNPIWWLGFTLMIIGTQIIEYFEIPLLPSLYQKQP